jgi:hypothetical protein
MISTQRPKVGDGKRTKVTREVDGDDLLLTMEVIGSDICCKQVFKRIE